MTEQGDPIDINITVKNEISLQKDDSGHYVTNEDGEYVIDIVDDELPINQLAILDCQHPVTREHIRGLKDRQGKLWEEIEEKMKSLTKKASVNYRTRTVVIFIEKGSSEKSIIPRVIRVN